MKKEFELSIVIPAYNEEKIIRNTLRKVLFYLENRNFSWEVLVVDDGSKDRTSEIVKKFAEKKVQYIRLKENRGKGAALKRGILKAKGEFIIFMDADLSVDLSNIEKFLNVLKGGEDVVIASRRVKGAEIKVHQPWYRENMGRIFTFLTRTFMGVKLTDFTCGFKGFSKVAAKKIFKNSLIPGWAYDAEIMFLAKKYGYKIVELPVNWVNRKDTRVKLKKVIFETSRDLFKIRLNNLFGFYD